MNKKIRFKIFVETALIGIQQFAKILDMKPSELKKELRKIVLESTKNIITDEEYEEHKKYYGEM